MAIRTDNQEGYRFGFNSMENDNETYGTGNALDFGARIYDPRLGRWLSLDPLMKKYPGESNYAYVSDNPIVYVDVDGKDRIYNLYVIDEDGNRHHLATIVVTDENAVMSVVTNGTNHTYFDVRHVVQNVTLDLRKPAGKNVTFSEPYPGPPSNDYTQNLWGQFRASILDPALAWGNLIDLKGSGGTQPGGIILTSEGADLINGTKYKSTNPPSGHLSIDGILAATGSKTKGLTIPNNLGTSEGVADLINSWTELFKQVLGHKEQKPDPNSKKNAPHFIICTNCNDTFLFSSPKDLEFHLGDTITSPPPKKKTP